MREERIARSARRDGHNINATTVTTGRATAREFRYSSLSACCDLRAPRVQSNRIFRDAALVQFLLGRSASPESLKSFRFPNEKFATVHHGRFVPAERDSEK